MPRFILSTLHIAVSSHFTLIPLTIQDGQPVKGTPIKLDLRRAGPGADAALSRLSATPPLLPHVVAAG
jgi:hypothetical protein